MEGVYDGWGIHLKNNISNTFYETVADYSTLLMVKFCAIKDLIGG